MSVPLAIDTRELTRQEVGYQIDIPNKLTASMHDRPYWDALAFDILSTTLYQRFPQASISSWESEKDSALRLYDYFLIAEVWYLDGQAWG